MGDTRPIAAAPLDAKASGRGGEKGYRIRGSQHKPGCRCRACRVVRMRAREKRAAEHVFYCS